MTIIIILDIIIFLLLFSVAQWFFSEFIIPILIFAAVVIIALSIAYIIGRKEKHDVEIAVKEAGFDHIKNAEIGSTVKFGRYATICASFNGEKDVTWIVLAKNNEKVLLISKYILGYEKYYDIENFLEGFLNRKDPFCFTESEKNIVLLTPIDGNKPVRAFLLSLEEAEKYFSSNEERATRFHNDFIKDREWLLRNSHNSNLASEQYFCDSNGDFSAYSPTNHYYIGVRPAIWVETE